MAIFIVREVLFTRVITTLIELVQCWALIFRKIVHSLFHSSCSDYFLPIQVGAEGYCCKWSHTKTQTHSAEFLWTRDRPVAETWTWNIHNTQNWQTSMPAGGHKPAIPASKRPQTHSLDRAATGIGTIHSQYDKKW